MANQNTGNQSSQSTNQSAGTSGGNTGSNKGNRGEHFPLDNLTFDILTVLQEKSKGLEAFDKYLRDAQGDQKCTELLNRLRQQDVQACTELKQHLQELLSGKGTGQGSKAA